MFLEKYRKAHFPKTVFPEFKVDPQTCTHCGRCVESCPTMGLVMGPDELPSLRGFKGIEKACLACRNCEAVCPVGACTIVGTYRVLEGRYKTILPEEVLPPGPLAQADGRSLEEALGALSPIERTILTRRSTRLFQDKPVPKEMILRILEAGRYAPSAGNCQPWKFVVITDRAVIREIEAECMKVLRRFRDVYMGERPWNKSVSTLLSYLYVNKMDQRPMTAIEKADHCDNVIHWNAPVVIFILVDTRGISNPDLDGGICAQNMVLAAHGMGLGTCYIGLTIAALDYLPSMRKKLGIVPPWKALTSLSIGFPKGRIDKPVARNAVPVEWIEPRS